MKTIKLNTGETYLTSHPILFIDDIFHFLEDSTNERYVIKTVELSYIK